MDSYVAIDERKFLWTKVAKTTWREKDAGTKREGTIEESAA